MLQRHVTPRLLNALKDTPVILVNGARQTGKSTLGQQLVSTNQFRRYLTFDEIGVLAAAQHDPEGFLAGLEGPVVLDEVQRAPELFLALKREVDRDRRPGRFLLTGSANVMHFPRIAESLAGRMETLTLWPFSQGELEGAREGFLDVVWGDATIRPFVKPSSRAAMVERILRGGYPEVIHRAGDDRRTAWFHAYVTAILQRDVQEIAQIEGLTALPRLFTLLAARASTLLNVSEISRALGLPLTTLQRYLALLEMTFLIQTVPAWSSNQGKRLTRSPKLILNDTGLLAHLLGVGPDRVQQDPHVLGPLLENFVAMELKKQLSWHRTPLQLYHFRTHAGREVDWVLEGQSGDIVGIEVKATSTIRADDTHGLLALQEAAGRKFHRGIVLYLGHEVLPFGRAICAIPLDSMWRLPG